MRTIHQEDEPQVRHVIHPEAEFDPQGHSQAQHSRHPDPEVHPLHQSRAGLEIPAEDPLQRGDDAPCGQPRPQLGGESMKRLLGNIRAVKHSTTHPHRKSGIINRPNLDEFVFFKLTCNNFLAEKEAQIKSNDEADQSRPPTASKHCRDPDDFGI